MNWANLEENEQYKVIRQRCMERTLKKYEEELDENFIKDYTEEFDRSYDVGFKEGWIEQLVKLVKDGFLDEKTAQENSGVSEQEFQEWIHQEG